jgi:hypothetical protein
LITFYRLFDNHLLQRILHWHAHLAPRKNYAATVYFFRLSRPHCCNADALFAEPVQQFMHCCAVQNASSCNIARSSVLPSTTDSSLQATQAPGQMSCDADAWSHRIARRHRFHGVQFA